MEATQTYTAIRRQDRAKDDQWIREFLKRAPFGFIATVAEGQPFLNSNLFVYEEASSSIFYHSARTGRTPLGVSDRGKATFSAAVMGRMLPASEALEFSVEYSAVVAFGEVAPVEAEREKRHALELLMAKYAPHLAAGSDYRPITDGEVKRTGVHRFLISSWSGKEKTAPADHEGAFEYPTPRPPL